MVFESGFAFLIFPLALGFLALGPILLHYSALKVQKSSLDRESRDVREALEEEKSQTQRYEGELRRTEEFLRHARPHQKVAEAMDKALEEMERVWLDPASQEEDCRIVLRKNLWVLWPDYALDPERTICERNLKNVVGDLFGDEAQSLVTTTYDIPTKEALKVDLCGWADVGASLQPSLTHHNKRVLLLIELKRPSIAIGKAAIEQTYAYAFGLMKLAASELWGQPIDCLAIGGAVDGGANDLHLRFGADTHGAIRITPLTYQNLIDRAHVICSNFVVRERAHPVETFRPSPELPARAESHSPPSAAPGEELKAENDFILRAAGNLIPVHPTNRTEASID